MSTPRLSKSLEQIRTELYARMEAVQDEYAAQGWLPPQRLNLNKGIARGLIELFAWGLWQLYQLLEQVHGQAVPLSASGDWLDIHAEQVGLARKEATRARGRILFTRAPGVSGVTEKPNLRIPAGRIVRTRPDGRGDVYRYVTLADAVLPAGSDTVEVEVRAEEYGAAANAAPGQVVELATPVPGVGAVTNRVGWLIEEGANAEPDAMLRTRYALAWREQAGVTAAAYAAAALSVPGVVGVYIADQHPRGEGTVDVIVQGAAGLPTEQLLEAVRVALAGRIRINHDVQVKAPTPVEVDVAMRIELLTGDPTATEQAARSWVEALFRGDRPDITGDVPGFGIGADVVRDRMAAGIVTLPGVKRIVWTAPTADVDIPPYGLASLRNLTITTAWAEEA